MPTTSKLNLEYPTEGQPEWYPIFRALINSIDAHVWIAIENTNLILTGGGTVGFDSGTGTLSWSADLEIISTLSGGKIVIPAGSLPGIADGEVIYVEVARPVNGIKELTLSSGLGIGDNLNKVFVGLRRGNNIVLRNQLDVVS